MASPPWVMRAPRVCGSHMCDPYNAFSVFQSVRPATAALQRPRDERWRHMRARPGVHHGHITGHCCSVADLPQNGGWKASKNRTPEYRRESLPQGRSVTIHSNSHYGNGQSLHALTVVETSQTRSGNEPQYRFLCLVGARNGRDNFRSIRSATIMRIAERFMTILRCIKIADCADNERPRTGAEYIDGKQYNG